MSSARLCSVLCLTLAAVGCSIDPLPRDDAPPAALVGAEPGTPAQIDGSTPTSTGTTTQTNTGTTTQTSTNTGTTTQTSSGTGTTTQTSSGTATLTGTSAGTATQTGAGTTCNCTCVDAAIGVGPDATANPPYDAGISPNAG
jgi:hypothetical protein